MSTVREAEVVRLTSLGTLITILTLVEGFVHVQNGISGVEDIVRVFNIPFPPTSSINFFFVGAPLPPPNFLFGCPSG